MPDSSQPTDRHAWHGARERSAAARADGKQARQRKIYIIAALMLVLVGAVAALLFYWREAPRPALAVLRIDQYRDARIPFSPWATQDRESLHNLGMQENNTFTSQEKELLKQALQNLGHDQAADQPLVIYLCAYAAVPDDGTVALLPADARLDDQATWLPVKEVLAALQKCPVKRRLLLLDLGLPCVEPKVGLLAANVPEHLKPILETAIKDDPNLQILTACAPGQNSLASEELGHTVFAHYLIQGLAGRADGFPNKKPDSRVTVRELVDYVTQQVDHWALQTTGLRQTPEFFGSATTDYELTGTDGKTIPETVPLPRDYPSFLTDAWTERDRWCKDRQVRTPPEQLRQLEQALIRADDRWRKGEDSGKVESSLKSAVSQVRQARLDSIGPPNRSEPRSLAEAVARGQKLPDGSITEALRQLKILGNLYAHVKLAKPPDKPSEMEVAQLTKGTEEFLKKYEDKPFDLAWTIFNAARKDSDLRWEHVRCWCDLLHADGKPLPPYEEIRYLQRLADLSVTKPDDWPSAAPAALRLVEQADLVETMKPQLQPWLKEEFSEAKRRRGDAEALLFSETAADRARATVPLMESVLDAYRDLLTHLTTLAEARRTLDEAFVFLPAYSPYLEHDPSRLDVWLAAVQDALLLAGLLKQKPDAKDVPALIIQVSQRTATLRNSLNKLRAPLEAAAAATPIAASQSPLVADVMEMRALLRLPALSAAQRQKIWANARVLADRLNEKAIQGEASTDTLLPPGEARAVSQESERALLRVRISQGLLRLAGYTEMEKIEAARKRVERTPSEDTAWEALRRELRQAWKTTGVLQKSALTTP